MAVVEWVGVGQFQALLEGIKGNIDRAVGQATFEEAQIILHDAVAITPYEFGTLRASGHVRPPQKSGWEWFVEIAFGGAAASYAVYVHEIMGAYHKPPTQAKFLEQPVLRAAPRFAGRVATRTKGIIGA
jgi:hypothetical protein